MTPATLRKFLTWGHFIASLVIGTYLYSPWSADPVFKAVTLYIVFPGMALSGLIMWNMGRILRAFGKRRT